MKHPISRYIAEHEHMNQSRFAEMCRLSAGFVCDLIKGRSAPSVETAQRICAATGGEIQLVELLTWKKVAELRPATDELPAA